jgi:hypothetical protein
VEEDIGRRRRNEDHYIIVEHGTLMSMKEIYFDFWKSFVFHS